DINNKRSMIYIDNLSEFIRLVIKDNVSGVYCPQNAEYVNVSNLVKTINSVNNKKIYMISIFNPIIKLCMNINVFQKVFGDLIYEQKLSEIYNSNGFKLKFEVTNFVESVRWSENEK